MVAAPEETAAADCEGGGVRAGPHSDIRPQTSFRAGPHSDCAEEVRDAPETEPESGLQLLWPELKKVGRSSFIRLLLETFISVFVHA